MADDDKRAPLFGIEVHDVGPGAATASLEVVDSMLNIMGVCHGGLIFTLADTAMERASNADDSDSVAVHAEVDFIAPGPLGARLVATAATREQWGRTKLIDVRVHDEATGHTIAEFRGRTRATKRT